MYFDESITVTGPSTPLKENVMNDEVTFATPTAEPLLDSAQKTVRKQLLSSASKRERKSPAREISESKLKTPTKSPSAKTNVGKSTVKKSTKKTPTASAKKTPTMSAKKKKRIAELESQIQEIEDNLAKLKKQNTAVKMKMTKLAKSEGEIKFPIKDELIEKVDLKGRPLVPLPEPLLKLEDLLPDEAIHDAIAVWNFINSFNKQLSISVSWDDFLELIKFTHSTSQALVDLFSAPLRLILSDPVSLNRIHASLPKKALYSYRHTDDVLESFPSDSGLSSQLPQNISNTEDFDNLYNGLKLLPRKLRVDLIDSLRFNSVLRSIFLRLEPIRQLRKAVSEATVALQYYQEHGHDSSHEFDESSVTINQFVQTLQELNRRYFFLPQGISNTEVKSDVQLPSQRKVAFETPNAKLLKGDRSEGSASQATLLTTGKKIALDSETMSRINTPKSKSRNKSSGLNKDAIFNITSNFILNLQDYYDIAKALETKEVHELSPVQKLTVLKALCDACMDTERIQQLMERNAEERANQIQQMNRLAKEQKLKLKEVSSGKREAALEACRRLNREKALSASAAEKKEGSGSKKGGKSSKGAKSIEPNVEQLTAMIDDLIALEPYGIETVREDPVFEEISDSEEGEESEEGEDASPEDEENEDGEGKRGRSARRRKPAAARTRAMSKQRSRAEKLQRNNAVAYALERIASAIERNTERELRNVIKVAEKAGFKGVDEKTGQIYVTDSLRQVYRQLHELEQKAKEDKVASKHEKALEEFFVRTEPLGTDRHRRIYWKFMADDNRLFVETREEDAFTKDFGPCPPTASSSAAVDQVVLNRLFESRPNRFQYKWLVYSTSSELWKLCEALDDRGEREKELKAAIMARFDIEAPAVVYQSTGSEFIGRKVQRTFGRKTVYGTVVGWLPPTEEDQALWHVVHVDGDEEDLDEGELKIALIEGEDQSAKEVEMKTDEVTEESKQQIDEKSVTANEAMAAVSSPDCDEKEEKSVEKEEDIHIPAIVKKSNGLSRGNHHSRSMNVGLHGVEGLCQECQRFLNIIGESLKKKLNDRFSREEKKIFDQRLRNAETLDDLRAVVLEVEDLIHLCQAKADRREKEESRLAKEEERQEMIEEGWVFDEKKCELIGRKGRRYFSKFGVSDGVIVAMLTAEKNEGVALFRMIHNDGDREDLELEDVLQSLRYYDSNFTEVEIRAELKEQRGEDEEDSEEEDDDEDEDDMLIDDSSQSSNLPISSEGLLWPTLEIRQRWKDAVNNSCTTGELALAIACLEEHTFNFGLYGELDPVFPLTLFAPPVDAETARILAQSSRYSQRQRGNAESFHHEALSPRKAKKRAISEISKCQKEESRSISSEDLEPRRSKRVVGTSQISSNHSSSNNLQFYNSGRPSRSAAGKVVSYAV